MLLEDVTNKPQKINLRPDEPNVTLVKLHKLYLPCFGKIYCGTGNNLKILFCVMVSWKPCVSLEISEWGYHNGLSHLGSLITPLFILAKLKVGKLWPSQLTWFIISLVKFAFWYNENNSKSQL